MIWVFIVHTCLSLVFLFASIREWHNLDDTSGRVMGLLLCLGINACEPFLIERNSMYQNELDMEARMVFVDQETLFIWDGENTTVIRDQEQVDLYNAGGYLVVKEGVYSWYNSQLYRRTKLIPR